MSQFCFWLIAAVIALAFALAFFGAGKVAVAVAIVAVIVSALAIWAVNQSANSIVDGHGPCSGGEERKT